jgi:hypothetical protein
MTFAVRDLMLDVLPAPDANSEQLQLCEIASQGPPGKPKPGPGPKPGPKPKPGGPKPDCTIQTANGPTGIDASAELASLAFLREQLQQALHP